MNLPDNYKSLTKLAARYNHQLGNWINRPVGKNAIAQFTENYPDIENPVIVIKGRSANRGTWAHENLAVKFLQWCNPDTVQGLFHQNTELKTENRQLRKIVLEGIPYNELPRQILPAHEVERQLNTEYENRIIGMRANTDNAHVMSWLKRFEDDPLAHDLVERMFLSDASVNPGYLYDKAIWGTKAALDRACEKWEIFDRIIEMMRGNPYWLNHYQISELTPIELQKLITQIE